MNARCAGLYAIAPLLLLACQKTTEPVRSWTQNVPVVDAATASDGASSDLETVRAMLRTSDQKPVEVQAGRIVCPGQLKLNAVTARSCLRVWSTPSIRVYLGEGDTDVVCVTAESPLILACTATGEASYAVGRLP
jgi:hypothetical protein